MALVHYLRRSSSLGDTHACAGLLASVIQRGDVVLLLGDLGAGKTAFTKGFAAALGITDEVTSPTFTIMRSYEANLPNGSLATFLHLDAYRLDGPQAAEDIGLLELLDEGAFALIEWGDIVGAAFGNDALVIEFLWVSEQEREIVIRADDDGPWGGRIAHIGGSHMGGGSRCSETNAVTL